jgi:hypothetical protein
MPLAANVKFAQFDEAYDALPDGVAQLRLSLLEAEPGSAHARHLQHLLFEAYNEAVAEEKLPTSQRLALIVGVTLGLWMLIAAGTIAII